MKRIMCSCALVVVFLLPGCKWREPIQVATADQEWQVPPPVGFVGDWVQVWPASRKGDTLTLRADSTAKGLTTAGRADWYGDDTTTAAVTWWKVRFMSHEPSTQRADWWGGHEDGGEYSCFANPDEKCRSGPMLCLGNKKSFECVQFRFTPDSLALSSGDRYVRVRHPPTDTST
jgi:hypothetical protein